MRKTFVMVAVLGGLLVVGLWLYAVLASSDSPQRPSAPTAQAEKFADSAEMKKQKSMEVKKGRSEPRIDRPDLPCRDPATFPSMVATPPGAAGQGAEPPARRDAGPPSAGGFSVPPGTTLVGPSPQIQIPPAALLSPPQDWGTRDCAALTYCNAVVGPRVFSVSSTRLGIVAASPFQRKPRYSKAEPAGLARPTVWRDT